MIRTWSRREIEETAALEPEHVYALNVRASVKFLKLLLDWAWEHGQEIEIVSAHGDPDHAELRFFRRG